MNYILICNSIFVVVLCFFFIIDNLIYKIMYEIIRKFLYTVCCSSFSLHYLGYTQKFLN